MLLLSEFPPQNADQNADRGMRKDAYLRGLLKYIELLGHAHNLSIKRPAPPPEYAGGGAGLDPPGHGQS